MAPASLQEQARALGDPTRHAIFRLIAGADHPVGIAEINEHLPLNHNAIRQHVAKLVAAGLVVESRARPTGRGRPRLVYEINPAAAGRWDTSGDRKSTRLNSSHVKISYAVFCLKKKNK